MDLRNVETFLSVAKYENITRAAEQLGYVQSTVTAQIQQLEKELGVPLFDRIGKGVVLTMAGHRFVEYAEELLQTADKARLLGKHFAELRGQLSVGTVESLFVWFLSDYIAEFHRMFPLIDLRIKTAAGSDLLDYLKHGELDFLFLLDRQISDKDFVRTLSVPVNIVFVTHPDNPLLEQEEVLLSDVVRQPLVLTERNSIYRRALEEQAALHNLYIAPFLEVDNTGIISRMVSRGLGVSLLPEYTVKKSIQRGRLVKIDVQDCNMQFWAQVFYHKNKWMMPQMEGFIDIIKQSFRQ